MLRIRNMLLDENPNLQFRYHNCITLDVLIVKHRFLYYVFYNDRLKIVNIDNIPNIIDILN